jgi:hypothetical protein
MIVFHAKVLIRNFMQFSHANRGKISIAQFKDPVKKTAEIMQLKNQLENKKNVFLSSAHTFDWFFKLFHGLKRVVLFEISIVISVFIKHSRGLKG